MALQLLPLPRVKQTDPESIRLNQIATELNFKRLDVSGGAVAGSGTLNNIPLWTPDGLTLGNSILSQSGTTVTAAGSLTATSTLTAVTLTVSGNGTVGGTLLVTGTLTGAAANFSGAVSTGALSATTGTLSGTLAVTGTLTGAASNFSGVMTLSNSSASAGTLLLTSTTNGNGITIGGDTNIYRLSAGILATDDNFQAAGDGLFGTTARADIGGGAYAHAGSFTNHQFRIRANNTDYLTLQTTGNFHVGGTADNGYKLEVAGTGHFTGALSAASTLLVTGVITNSSLTASLPVFTDGSKALVSNAMTGAGSVMMSASPTTTGTLTGAAANFSGAVSTGALSATTGAFTGNLQVDGIVGIGTTVQTNTGLWIRSSGLLGTSQVGISSDPAFGSGATTAGLALSARLRTAASAFTMVSGIGLNIETPSIGAGSAVTTNYGIKVEDQTGGGTNYALYTGAGMVRFGGALTAASTLDVTGNVTLGGGALIYSSALTIRANTADGSDSLKLILAGGGLADITRGAFINISGNEDGSAGGKIQYWAGNDADLTGGHQFYVGSSVLAMDIAHSGAISIAGVVTHTAAPVFSSVTASQFLMVDGSKSLISVAGTGTGSVMRAVSPTTTGTLTADAIAASGRLTASGNSHIGGTADNAFKLEVTGSTRLSGALTVTSTSQFDLGATFSSTVTTTGLITANGGVKFNNGSSTLNYYEESSFTATLTGVTGIVTTTIRYVRNGSTVTLFFFTLTGTSNATTCTITGLPANLIPTVDQFDDYDGIYDNGNNHLGGLLVKSTGVIQPFFRTSLTTAANIVFTNANTKGLDAGNITYILT